MKQYQVNIVSRLNENKYLYVIAQNKKELNKFIKEFNRLYSNKYGELKMIPNAKSYPTNFKVFYTNKELIKVQLKQTIIALERKYIKIVKIGGEE